MCTVLCWKGKMPKGLLTHLLVEAETRGRDSVGIAFRSENQTVAYRHAVPSSVFVKRSSAHVGEARRSQSGIAHTRRASRGMPIDNVNAHPFIFQKFVFAHNGKIDNWKELKAAGVTKYEAEAKAATTPEAKAAAEALVTYYKGVTTDSMILGPYISARNFTDVTGCMGLVWIQKNSVYAFHSAKELSCATLKWNYTTGEDTSTHELCVVASTSKILGTAIGKMKDVASTYDFVALDENRVYRIEENGPVDEGAIPVNPANHADAFTSAELDEALALATAEIEAVPVS